MSCRKKGFPWGNRWRRGIKFIPCPGAVLGDLLPAKPEVDLKPQVVWEGADQHEVVLGMVHEKKIHASIKKKNIKSNNVA